MSQGDIQLHVIRCTDVDHLPDFRAIGGKCIADWFREATGDKLRLNLQFHGVTVDSLACDHALLHSVVRKVIAPPQGRPVQEIALLFCRHWSAGGLEGLMFDYTGDDPLLGRFGDSNGVPREACAVFTDSFADTDDRGKVFSAIHELGHVFNLVHDQSGGSFMARFGGLDGFLGADCQRLTSVSEGNWIHSPGGANFLSGDPPARVSAGHRIAPARRGWNLKANLGKDSFLPGEPVLLDLELVPRGRPSGTIESRLDPGYDALAIWFETPRGERRRHQPPYHYCRRVPSPVEVSPARPLRNNPRITHTSTRLNFEIPGTYRIWAEYTPPSAKGQRGTGTILSNVLEFEVRRPRGNFEQRISQTLCLPSVAQFMTYKGGPMTTVQRRALHNLVRKDPTHDSLQVVRYALGASELRHNRLRGSREALDGIRPPVASLRRGVRRMQAHLRKAGR
jgi:hypothetical protein